MVQIQYSFTGNRPFIMYTYTGTRLVLIPSFIEEKIFGKMANFMISCTERMKLLAIVYKSYKIIIASIDMIVINVRVPKYSYYLAMVLVALFQMAITHPFLYQF